MRTRSRRARKHAPWLIGLALCCAPASQESARAAGPVTISVVSTNDVHGRIWQLPLFGGFLQNLRAARQRDGGGVLLLDAGDIFQGTLESNSTEGAAMIRAYRALGYDAAALGNHEFDFGPVGPSPVPAKPGDDPLGALKARLREADFPILSSNLRRSAGGAALPKLRRSALLQVAGQRIGVVGGITRDALIATHSGNTKGLELVPLADAVASEAAGLRKAGARAVIALVHAGGECRDFKDPDDLSSCDPDSEAFELARALPSGSVDLIVGGHTHSGVAQRVNGIAIIEAYSNGRAFGRADLILQPSAAEKPSIHMFPPQKLCPDDLDQPSCANESYEGAPVQRDARVLATIKPDLARARALRDRPIGVDVSALVARAGPTESPCNNLIADLILRGSPGADAAFSNSGAVRVPLPVGPLTYGTVFEMFPFDNTFATLRISAREFSRILANNLAQDHGILSIAGVRAVASCEEGEIAVDLYGRDGQPIAPDRPLTVVTSDFLAMQGDNALAGLKLRPGQLTISQNRLIRDAIIRGLQSFPGGRVDGNDKTLFDPDHLRIRYPGSRPMRCGALATANSR
jgi:2',3'-cyclic-nucleotide 2'-phosphodiesterase (5'-nucleotidase family)